MHIQKLGCLLFWLRRFCFVGWGGGLCCGCFGGLAQSVDDDAQHLFFGGGLAGPDFELARALLHEHLDARDDGDVLLAGQAEERRFERVVDEIEDELGVQVLRFEDAGRSSCRPCRRAWS